MLPTCSGAVHDIGEHQTGPEETHHHYEVRTTVRARNHTRTVFDQNIFTHTGTLRLEGKWKRRDERCRITLRDRIHTQRNAG